MEGRSYEIFGRVKHWKIGNSSVARTFSDIASNVPDRLNVAF